MNYLSICRELEDLESNIKYYELEIEKKKSRVSQLEKYKKLIEKGSNTVYVEAKDLIKLKNPIFILLNSEQYFKKLKKVLLDNYKLLLDNPITITQGNWETFDLEMSSVIWNNKQKSKVIFHKDLSENYYAELLLELNKLDNFKIEIEKQELTKTKSNQFVDVSNYGDFNYSTLKGITKFKVAKFEKVLQLLNFPKVIDVVNQVQYIFNNNTKEYELKFKNLK